MINNLPVVLTILFIEIFRSHMRLRILPIFFFDL